MTPKQQIFCDEYLKDRNATRAYKVAYPNCKSDIAAGAGGYENLRKPQIAEYIEKHQQHEHDERIADAEEVRKFLTSMMRGEIADETVTPSGVVVAAKAKASDRNNAAKMLARMYGIDSYSERQKLKLERERFEFEKSKTEASGDDDGVVIEL